MKRLAMFCGLVAVLAVFSGGRAAGDLPGPAENLPAPAHLTSETRSELDARMGRHGETMSNLVRSVVLLDRPTIRTLASRIADEEIVARINKPLRESKRLRLPPEFFVQQSVLGEVARALAAAALGSDDQALADAFAALTRTCVSCHSVYLHGRPEPLPFGPKTK